MARRNRERDRSILWYGLFTNMNFSDIGLKHGVSTTRVRRIFFSEAQSVNRRRYNEVLEDYQKRVDDTALTPDRVIMMWHREEFYRDLVDVPSKG